MGTVVTPNFNRALSLPAGALMSEADSSRDDPGNRVHRVELAEGPEPRQWKPFPQWASWFVDFGYTFPLEDSKKTLTIISTPTDSAGAGLIALGLIRRRLEAVWGEDAAGYYERILRLATRERGATLKSIATGAIYQPIGTDKWGLRALCVKGRQKEEGQIKYVMPNNVADWQIGEEPPVLVHSSRRMELSPVMEALFPQAQPIIESNLARSDASVCLVTHSNGRSITERRLSDFRLRTASKETSLSDLILPDRRLNQVARLSLLNPRTREFYWRARKPDVAVCDGGRSFMNVVKSRALGPSRIIAVASRVCSVDEMEDLAECWRSNEQWFEEAELPTKAPPPGVDVLHLEER